MGKSDLIFAGLALGTGALCWALHGLGAVGEAMVDAVHLALIILPMLAAGLLIGGLIQQLVNKDRVTALLGTQSGFRGLLLSSLAGMLTPGGPFTSFPVVYALWVAGADAGALVAYVAAWSLIGLNRLIIWEFPFLGVDLSLVRFLVSLPLPLVAGLTARWLVQVTPLKLRETGP